MPRRKRPDFHLRVTDYRDRELLYIIDDLADADGVVEATEVARQLGFVDGKGKVIVAPVSMRFAWMERRYKQLRRVAPKTSADPVRWAITENGRALMHGRITASVMRELDKNHPGTELLLIRELTRRTYIEGDPATAAAIRREVQYAEARRVR